MSDIQSSRYFTLGVRCGNLGLGGVGKITWNLKSSQYLSFRVWDGVGGGDQGWEGQGWGGEVAGND